MNTCDECQFYNLFTGHCVAHNEFRPSCGAEACDDFLLAEDLEEMEKNGEIVRG